MPITATAIAPALGAQVTGVDLAQDSGTAEQLAATAERLRQLLHEFQVLVLPDQTLDAVQLQALAEQLGQPLEHPAYRTVANAPAVQVLESTAENPSKIERWHTDMSFSPQPPPMTLLHAQVVPASGGDTLWASAAAAYEALSPALQGLVVELTALHDFRKGFAESLAEPGGEQRLAAALAANPPVSHPLVLQHPHSGRCALYVNPLFTSRIEQLGALESEHLLAFLCAEIVREEHQMRLQWQPGTLAIWDNRVTQHRPINDYFPAQRVHHRVTIAG
ncbi:MAG: TauD/TfdA dioxygenase family protein [Pseudomonadales bacterium]